MARRISYNQLKKWIAESEFAQEQGMSVGCWSGYYRLLHYGKTELFCAETPGKLWEMFCIYRDGYFKCMVDKKL